MLHIDLSEQDAGLLRDLLEAKLTELRREESHTDSPRYRATLYDLDAMLERLLAQLPKPAQSNA
jgi:arylsulfatase A-like enzyme